MVTVCDHGATPVPSSLADDMHLGGQKRVGGADDGPDIEVVLPVLDGYMECVAMRIEIGDDRFIRPVAVLVDNVAAVAMSQQVAVEPRVIRPGFWVGPDAYYVIRHCYQIRDESRRTVI